MRLQARHYRTGELVEIVTAAGRIESVTSPTAAQPDYSAGWVAPALFDLQINGCEGRSFNSAQLTVADIQLVVAVCRRHGIGQLCPTLVTNAFAALQQALTTLRQACDTDAKLNHALPAIHVEGPYISPEDGPRGAHPRQHVRPPDQEEFKRLQDAAGGRIRLMTLAPEHENALSFIDWLTKQGVVVALGHTAASPARIADAVRAGARLSTHLGNGAAAQMPRHDNVIFSQLAHDDLWMSIISDGHHLPPAVLRCLLRVKTPARTILTCDASSLAGLPPGFYREWDNEFEVQPGGRIVVPGTSYLAGSGVFTEHCIGHLVNLGEATLASAIEMATFQPRKLLGIPQIDLAAGNPADLMLFDWEPGTPLRVTSLLIGGMAHPV